MIFVKYKLKIVVLSSNFHGQNYDYAKFLQLSINLKLFKFYAHK